MAWRELMFSDFLRPRSEYSVLASGTMIDGTLSRMLLVVLGFLGLGPQCTAQGVPDKGSTFTCWASSLTPERALELSRTHTTLILAGLVTISPDVAAALAQPRSARPDHENMTLTLEAAKTIDADTARQLARHAGTLALPAVEVLSVDAAVALVTGPGSAIALVGLQVLSPDLARALTRCRRTWLILGPKSLSPEVAAILANCNSNLMFNRLESLSMESAQALQSHRRALDLGSAVIVAHVAEVLLGHEGTVGLTLAKRLEPGVGDILARHRFEVRLILEEINSAALARKLFSEPNASSSVYMLRTMSPEIAAVYAELEPGYLANLDTLSPQAAKVLASGSYDLNLPALAHLTPDLATALTARNRSVYLRGLKSLDGPDAVAVAEALASTPAPVYAPNLERISAPALAALRKKATITIPPDEKLTIVE